MSPPTVASILEERLSALLEYGKWVLVAYGWQKPAYGSSDSVTFGVMTCSIDEFPQVIDFLTRELDYDFNFGRSIPLPQMQDLKNKYSAVRVWDFPLPGFSGSFDDKHGVRLVRDTCAKYAATRWLERGVALVDITGFTQVGPTRQLASIMSLNKALNTAYARLRRISKAREESGQQSLALNFQRSTTGDGYYIWNDTWGGHGDTMVLALLLLTLSVLEHRRSEAREHPIRIKAAFTVGEVFCLADRGVTWNDEGSQIAVGPATNYLARILGKAVSGQFLVGQFSRSTPEGFALGPSDLLGTAAALLGELLPPDLVAQTEWHFDPPGTTVRVVDKHGDAHHCYNVVGHLGNMLPTAGSQLQKLLVRFGVPLDPSQSIETLRFVQDGDVRPL